MMAEAVDHEKHKERLRAAGRRALEDFRRQRAAGGRGRGLAPGLGPGFGPVQGPDRSPTVELTTFRVVTQPAAATVGPAPSHEAAELRLLTPAMAMSSTSLGALPPGSSCLLSGPGAGPTLGAGAWPLSSSPCSVTSDTGGAASVSSLASSSHTGYATPAPSAATSASVCASPSATGVGVGLVSVGAVRGLGSSLAAAAAREEERAEGEDEGQLRADVAPRAGSASRGGGGAADPMVDMLLAQVEALMRDKASLAAENAGLRQQVEQLTELVGWLSLERAGSEGEAGSIYTQELGGEELTESAYGASPSRPPPELEDWEGLGRGREGADESFQGAGLPGVGDAGGVETPGADPLGAEPLGAEGARAFCEEAPTLFTQRWGSGASGGSGQAAGEDLGGGGAMPGQLRAEREGERTHDGAGCAGSPPTAGSGGGLVVEGSTGRGVQAHAASSGVDGAGQEGSCEREGITAAAVSLMEGGPLGPPGPLGSGG